VVWSFYNHHANFVQAAYDRFNNTPGGFGPPFERPPSDIRQYWRAWLDRDGFPWWPFWENVRSWWAIRDLPNVLLVHFANLKRDPASEIRRIAAFLDIPIDEPRWDAIQEYCSFEWMKANATRMAPRGGASWEGGARGDRGLCGPRPVRVGARVRPLASNRRGALIHQGQRETVRYRSCRSRNNP